MNIITVIIFLIGIYLIVEGSRIVFSKKYFDKIMKTTWKDTDEIMGKKQGFYYSKLRGIGMLVSGILATIVSGVILSGIFN